MRSLNNVLNKKYDRIWLWKNNVLGTGIMNCRVKVEAEMNAEKSFEAGWGQRDGEKWKDLIDVYKCVDRAC